MALTKEMTDENDASSLNHWERLGQQLPTNRYYLTGVERWMQIEQRMGISVTVWVHKISPIDWGRKKFSKKNEGRSLWPGRAGKIKSAFLFYSQRDWPLFQGKNDKSWPTLLIVCIRPLKLCSFLFQHWRTGWLKNKSFDPSFHLYSHTTSKV